jgi:NADH-quinone oxidoreductase subunit N
LNQFDFWANLPGIIPEIGLAILALVVLALDVGIPFVAEGLPESKKRYIGIIAGIALIGLAATPLIFEPPAGGELLFGGMIRHDVLSQIFKVMVLLAAGITSLISVDVKSIGRKGEYYLIIIVATLGATLMSSAADLIMVFLALETTSIPLYVLAGFKRDDQRSSESGMKYFLFGSFASAIMLFGFSLLYGFTGQTSLAQIAAYLGTPAFSANIAPTLIAMALVVVGFGFKISAVPFHFWTPDVYEGAPTPVTAFVSVASKAASFALLMRFFISVFPHTLVLNGYEVQNFWVQLVAVMAVISMTVGNVIALVQKNIKRLLAYSSIAQAGYTLMGVAAIQMVNQAAANGGPNAAELAKQAVASVAFYMFMYTFTNLLAFAVIIIFSEATGSETIADLAGLSRRNPWLALTMTIALLSLGGIPPTAGFFGKFFLFQAAVQAHLVGLAMIGVLNAIVALYYYLVVIKVMYVDHGQFEERTIPVSNAALWVLALTTVVVLLLGTIGAQPIFEWAARGVSGLFG